MDLTKNDKVYKFKLLKISPKSLNLNLSEFCDKFNKNIDEFYESIIFYEYTHDINNNYIPIELNKMLYIVIEDNRMCTKLKNKFYGENNILLKNLYKDFCMSNIIKYNNKHDYDFNIKIYDHIYSKIINHDIINIILQNFCKYHFVKHIDIKLQKYGIEYSGPIDILDSITIIIDETKQQPNNRKITFYKNFYDFYKIRDVNKDYKILKEDEFVLIEELDTIQNITKPIEIIKTSEDIIREKDAEIEKLKKEILELKKFYINT